MKRFGKYGRKVSRTVIRYGQYRRKLSRIEKRQGKYGRKVSWIVKRYEKYGRNPLNSDKIGKYRRKLCNDMENMEERQVE